MYKTIKLRIRADRERKQVLLAYEDIYHSALRKYVYQMILEGKPIRYDVKRIHKAIPKESKWQLYQTARNRYAYFLKHHDWEFHKSSIWNQRNFTVSQDTLILSFGKGFIVEQLVVGLACEKVEWEKVKEGMICRMDIVHDEQYVVCQSTATITVNGFTLSSLL